MSAARLLDDYLAAKTTPKVDPLAGLDRDAIVLLATDLPSTSRHPRDRAVNAAHDKAIRAARVWCTGEGIDWAALANERWATAEDRPPT